MTARKSPGGDVVDLDAKRREAEAEERAELEGAFAGFEHRTDMGNARRAARRLRDDVRAVWDGSRVRWFVWCGTHWLEDRTGRVVQLVARVVAEIYGEAAALPDAADRKRVADHARRSESARSIAAMMTLAASQPELAVRREDFDDPKRTGWLFSCLSSTLEIDPATGGAKPREHRRDDLISRVAPVTFDRNARCPFFDAFARRVLPDPAVRGFVMRALGSALVGERGEHVAYFFVGPGANGKTTLIEAVAAALGPYAATMLGDTLLARRSSSIPADVAALVGARFATCSETPENAALDVVRLKALCGGDTIAARPLYGAPFTFVPEFKLFVATNHRPIVRDTSEAAWRRIRVVPFDVVIPREEQDVALRGKLDVERSGILNRLLEGLRDWVSAGMKNPMPPAVARATNAYRAESDLVGLFVESDCEEKVGASVGSGDLFLRFELFCEGSGERPRTQRYFAEELRRRGFSSFKDSAGLVRWRGLELHTRGGDY